MMRVRQRFVSHVIDVSVSGRLVRSIAACQRNPVARRPVLCTREMEPAERRQQRSSRRHQVGTQTSSQSAQQRAPSDEAALRGGTVGPGVAPLEPFEVDTRRAIVPQVGRLGHRYAEWLERPILDREPLRMFENPFLEFASKTPWWTVPLLWVPLACWSLWWAAARHGTPPALMPPLLALGLLAWALLEYTLHRFVFHAHVTRPVAITLHYSLHGCHHKQPGDRLRLVFPPLFAAPLVAFFWHACRAAMGGLQGHGATVFAGMLLGYIYYDVSHYAMHSPGPALGWLRRARRVHLAHHFVDCSRSFGVSSDLMDRLLGTRPAC